MGKEDQEILVVKTSDLFPNGIWEGFRVFDDSTGILGLINNKGEYKCRGEMEHDPNYQQIIPQIVLTTQEKVFVHRIPVSGGESRLHDLWPIFLGGHAEKFDSKNISMTAEREFNEEIDYRGQIIKREFVGAVNLQDNLVNSVHFGLVWVYLGDSEAFKDKGDDGVTDGRFISWTEAEKLVPKMSYWSRVAFPTLKLRYQKQDLSKVQK